MRTRHSPAPKRPLDGNDIEQILRAAPRPLRWVACSALRAKDAFVAQTGRLFGAPQAGAPGTCASRKTQWLKRQNTLHPQAHVSVKSTLYDMPKNIFLKILHAIALCFWVLPTPILAHGVENLVQTSLFLFVVFNLVGLLLSILANWRNFKPLNKWRLLSIFLVQNVVQMIITWALFTSLDRKFEANTLKGPLLFWLSGWVFGIIAANLLAWLLALRLKINSSNETEL
ncbi:hypothetical protein [Turneriella parva]|uniref:hypothetical protein n=1 Tax=Turneriella parva TaxID=29510 RepID=UPI00031CFDE3|nr:hypothetical protein [Turneriella parva]